LDKYPDSDYPNAGLASNGVRLFRLFRLSPWYRLPGTRYKLPGGEHQIDWKVSGSDLSGHSLGSYKSQDRSTRPNYWMPSSLGGANLSDLGGPHYLVIRTCSQVVRFTIKHKPSHTCSTGILSRRSGSGWRGQHKNNVLPRERCHCMCAWNAFHLSTMLRSVYHTPLFQGSTNTLSCNGCLAPCALGSRCGNL